MEMSKDRPKFSEKPNQPDKCLQMQQRDQNEPTRIVYKIRRKLLKSKTIFGGNNADYNANQQELCTTSDENCSNRKPSPNAATTMTIVKTKKSHFHIL